MLTDFQKNYSITEHDIFLNHAATSPVGNTTIERMKFVADQMQRPLSEHFYPWLGIIEDTRRRLSELIHCHPTEITFCQNTSSALSLVALAIPWKAGDKVLAPFDEFPSNIYVWQNLKTKGVDFEFFNCPKGIPVIEVLKKTNLENVRLISISAVSYLTGRLYELKEIADFCHAHNIYVCFDAIQAIGATPFDIQQIDADFVASGGQKWLLGSIGTGFVYVKKELLENLLVPFVGWTSVKYPEDFSLKELDLASDVTRFEPGLPNILPIAALNQSLCDLSAIGWEKIYQQIKSHTLYLTQALEEQKISALANTNQQAGIVSFEVPEKLDLAKFSQYCKKNKIHLTQRENYIRISPHFYNTQEELDKLLYGLEITAKNRYPTPLKPQVSQNTAKQVLLTGATGILGDYLSQEIAAQGYHLTLIGRDSKKLELQAEKLLKLFPVTVKTFMADFNDQKSMDDLLQDLRTTNTKYDILVNCAGLSEADEFNHLTDEKIRAMFNVNFFAPTFLIKAFLNDLKSPNAQGILNILSVTGRISYPLLSAYGASNAALWTLGEALALELSQENLTVTTYIAPAMHSKMQKRLGRVALRYFKTDGNFPFDYPKRVAKEAWQAFMDKNDLFISKANRLRLFTNMIFPKVIKKRIRILWKQ